MHSSLFLPFWCGHMAIPFEWPPNPSVGTRSENGASDRKIGEGEISHARWNSSKIKHCLPSWMRELFWLGGVQIFPECHWHCCIYQRRERICAFFIFIISHIRFPPPQHHSSSRVVILSQAFVTAEPKPQHRGLFWAVSHAGQLCVTDNPSWNQPGWTSGVLLLPSSFCLQTSLLHVLV